MRGSAVRAALIALALVTATAPVVLSSAVLAEDNNPAPPKPKDPAPPPDPCRNSKQRSACRLAEQVRSLLREAPPPDPQSAPGDASSGTDGKVTEP